MLEECKNIKILDGSSKLKIDTGFFQISNISLLRCEQYILKFNLSLNQSHIKARNFLFYSQNLEDKSSLKSMKIIISLIIKKLIFKMLFIIRIYQNLSEYIKSF